MQFDNLGINILAVKGLTKLPYYYCCLLVDVYSFGVLLCEMCVRQQPDQEQRPSQIARMTNVRFRDLVSRCVLEQPGERPNMEGIIEELELFMLSRFSKHVILIIKRFSIGC